MSFIFNLLTYLEKGFDFNSRTSVGIFRTNNYNYSTNHPPRKGLHALFIDVHRVDHMDNLMAEKKYKKINKVAENDFSFYLPQCFFL